MNITQHIVEGQLTPGSFVVYGTKQGTWGFPVNQLMN